MEVITSKLSCLHILLIIVVNLWMFTTKIGIVIASLTQLQDRHKTKKWKNTKLQKFWGCWVAEFSWRRSRLGGRSYSPLWGHGGNTSGRGLARPCRLKATFLSNYFVATENILPMKIDTTAVVFSIKMMRNISLMKRLANKICLCCVVNIIVVNITW